MVLEDLGSVDVLAVAEQIGNAARELTLNFERNRFK